MKLITNIKTINAYIQNRKNNIKLEFVEKGQSSELMNNAISMPTNFDNGETGQQSKSLNRMVDQNYKWYNPKQPEPSPT